MPRAFTARRFAHGIFRVPWSAARNREDARYHELVTGTKESISQHRPPPEPGGDGLRERHLRGGAAELERALSDHELIKIKLALPERDDRAAMLGELVTASGAELVQTIGKMALLYRKNPQANPKLSNVKRFKRHHGRH